MQQKTQKICVIKKKIVILHEFSCVVKMCGRKRE